MHRLHAAPGRPSCPNAPAASSPLRRCGSRSRRCATTSPSSRPPRPTPWPPGPSCRGPRSGPRGARSPRRPQRSRRREGRSTPRGPRSRCWAWRRTRAHLRCRAPGPRQTWAARSTAAATSVDRASAPGGSAGAAQRLRRPTERTSTSRSSAGSPVRRGSRSER